MTRYRGLAVLRVIVVMVACALPALAQEPNQSPGSRIPVIQDWTHRHVIFGGGGSAAARAAATPDPRAWHEWLIRNQHLLSAGQNSKGKKPGGSQGIDIDWAVSLGTAGVAAGSFPAKYSFDVTAAPSCTTDFVVFPIAAATASASQANIIAFHNLYANSVGTGFCTGTTATVRWAYYVGTGPVKTSPVLSLTGTKVAFIESLPATSGAVFRVLTPVTGQGTSATVAVAPGSGGSSVTSLSYTPAGGLCAGPGLATNTKSSPFVDYTNDVAYVGADNGYLYKITGVFNGTPAVAGCALVTASATLTSPVYDGVLGRVFISDGTNLVSFDANLGSKTTLSPAPSVAGGIADAPIVDVTNGFAYLFTTSNGTNAVAVQVPYSGLTTFGTATSLSIGGTGGNALHLGIFDNAYFTTGPKSGAGSLYACGNQGSGQQPAKKPGLYRFAFTSGSGAMATTTFSNDLNVGSSTGECSPLTSFYNAALAKEYLFLGHTGGQNVEMWDITTALTNTTTTYTASTGTTVYNGGTSGIIVDGQGSCTDCSNIYFGTLTAGTQSLNRCGKSNFCAVKLTQGLLQ
jgi:hypothetical protein